MNENKRERGAVMIWALIFVVVTAGMVVSHSAYMTSHRRTMDLQLKRKPLAANFARAALTDGLSWFQAQANQPVDEFAPRRDMTVNPPVLDTQDPTVGLVREFEIRGNLWGRYEIRREETSDVSRLHGSSAPGSVWELGARGYVYRVVDASKPFDQAPNVVVSSSRVETTIRSVPIAPPAPAAIDVDDLSKLTIGPGGKVRNYAGPALAGPPLTGLLTFLVATLTSLVTGSPGVVTLPSYASKPKDVFKMTLPELRDLSDFAVTAASDKWLSQPLPEQTIVFHQGDLTITSANTLNGKLLLVVDGDLTVQAGTNSKIEGIVYVTGATDLRGPFTLLGTLIGRGDVSVQGNGTGQDAVVQYDPQAIQRLMQSLSRYRASRTIHSDDDAPSRPADAPATTGSTIHPTAQIDPDVTLGNNLTIEERVRIEEYGEIGSNTVVGSAAMVKKAAQVGSGVVLGSGVVIEEFATIGDNVTLGDNVKVGRGARVAAGVAVPANTQIPAGVTYNGP